MTDNLVITEQTLGTDSVGELGRTVLDMHHHNDFGGVCNTHADASVQLLVTELLQHRGTGTHERVHDKALCQSVKNRDLLRAELDDRHDRLVASIDSTTHAVTSCDITGNGN